MKPLKAEFQEAGDRKQEAVGGPCVRYRLLPSASCLPASAGLPRILHLITNFEVGGTERQAVELLKRLDPDRYDVRLAALRNQGPFYREIAGRFPDIPEFPLTSFYNANAVKQFLRLRALLARERVQILHAHDFYAGMIGAAAARSAGVKVIACQRHLRLSDRRVHEWGHRLIHRLAHRILVNSQAIRDHIVAAGSAPPEKVVVIENGLCAPDDDGTAPAVGAGRLSRHAEVCRELGLSQEAKLVGMVARLQPVKGHRFFLEAAAAVARADGNAHFILVGGGPLRGEIERQAAELGIADRVHLLGERADVGRLLSSFHLAALASLHEGLPNAVMEAMAAGVPV
ncbi:MAG TPA: glycosyltransferase, partial [Blastocatellia bacterium]|nr:glycosyltransferase [Blastocatellia bacterium]